MSDAVLNQFTPTSHDEPVIDTSRRLKFGIIGTGWIAESHVESLKQMPDVDIVAGADLIPGKAEKFFERFEVPNVRCYPDHTSMLEAEDLDSCGLYHRRFKKRRSRPAGKAVYCDA